jgi:hypothetical protein
MKKYPWEREEKINWQAGWDKIAIQYQGRYFKMVDLFIDNYFACKLWKAGCITGWSIAAILAYCLFVVTP